MNMAQIITVEGSDRTGKTTQAKLLADYLRSRGFSVLQLSFPTKNNTFGLELRKWLQGKAQYTPMAVNLLFEADRYQELPSLYAAEELVDYIVIDRFWRTGISYACYRGSPLTWSLQVSDPYVRDFHKREVLVNIRRQLDPHVIAGASEGELYDEAYDLEEVFCKVIDALNVIAPPKAFLKIDAQGRDSAGETVMRDIQNVHYDIVDELIAVGVIPDPEHGEGRHDAVRQSEANQF